MIDEPKHDMASGKSNPKDAQAVAALLKEMNISDYEPRVLNQVLEFTYRYATSVLEDAHMYSTFAKKKVIDTDDVKLAINLQHERNFTSPPSKDLTEEVAQARNVLPLPIIKTSVGPRLPPDRFNLTSCNFRLKSLKKPRTVHTVSRLNVVGGSPSMSLGNKPHPSLSFLRTSTAAKTSAASTPSLPRPTVTIAKPATSTIPILKFSDGMPSATSSILTNPPPVTILNPQPTAQLLMPTVGALNTEVKMDSDVSTAKQDDEVTEYTMEE